MRYGQSPSIFDLWVESKWREHLFLAFMFLKVNTASFSFWIAMFNLKPLIALVVGKTFLYALRCSWEDRAFFLGMFGFWHLLGSGLALCTLPKTNHFRWPLPFFPNLCFYFCSDTLNCYLINIFLVL